MTQRKQINDRNGILNIQTKVSLRCKLPWSCTEQTTGEDWDMTAQPPNALTQNTHTHTPLPQLWIPLATAVEKFSGDRERKAEQNGEKMRIKRGERDIGK